MYDTLYDKIAENEVKNNEVNIKRREQKNEVQKITKCEQKTK